MSRSQRVFPRSEINKTENMRIGKRIDLFTPTNFADTGELYKFIEMKCQ